MKSELFRKIKDLNLPAGKYVVVGGAMEAYGIREAGDIDILATHELFDDLAAKG